MRFTLLEDLWKIFDLVLWQKFIWLTQGLNVLLFFGKADETTSSRAYRLQDDKHFGWWLWSPMRKIIDKIFFWQEDHCKRSYEAEAAKIESWNRK